MWCVHSPKALFERAGAHLSDTCSFLPPYQTPQGRAALQCVQSVAFSRDSSSVGAALEALRSLTHGDHGHDSRRRGQHDLEAVRLNTGELCWMCAQHRAETRSACVPPERTRPSSGRSPVASVREQAQRLAVQLEEKGDQPIMLLDLKRCRLDDAAALQREPEYDVFVSHAGENKPMALRLHLFLSALGFDSFFDPQSVVNRLNRDVTSGVMRCRVMVCLVSRDFLRKKWPQAEPWSLMMLRDDNVDWTDRVAPIIVGMNVEQASELGHIAHDESGRVSDASSPTKLGAVLCRALCKVHDHASRMTWETCEWAAGQANQKLRRCGHESRCMPLPDRPALWLDVWDSVLREAGSLEGINPDASYTPESLETAVLRLRAVYDQSKLSDPPMYVDS